MKPTLRKRSCLFALLYGFTQAITAQTDVARFEWGLHAGTYNYQGDLSPSKFGSYKSPGLGAGFFAGMALSPSLSIRAKFDFGTIQDDEGRYSNPSWRQERSLSFKTKLSEISALLVWNVLDNTYDSKRFRFSPYVFGGVGYSSLKIVRDYSNFNYDVFSSTIVDALNEDINTPAPKGTVVLPVGFGVRHSVSPSMSLKLESVYRLTSTDYLDGFSKVANPGEKDRFFSNTVGVIFSIGKKNRLSCPSVR